MSLNRDLIRDWLLRRRRHEPKTQEPKWEPVPEGIYCYRIVDAQGKVWSTHIYRDFASKEMRPGDTLERQWVRLEIEWRPA